jgi:uncharacterized protein YjbI with pentapeptide repeats
VRVNPAKWRLPSLHDRGPTGLWRIGYALLACFAAAVAGLAVLWLAARALLGNPHLAPSKGITVHDAVGVAQLVFASVAGAGALVALVVAYRRQRVAEVATVEDKARVFNERFTAIAAQLGEAQPAVRLAGVHAMAGLANDWTENRQTCVDVLCAYLRLPYDPDPGEDVATADRAAYLANREVRHTIIRLICTHLRPDSAASWQGLNLDFTGVVFDGGNFTGATFSDGIVRFDGASFASGQVDFGNAEFSGGTVSFHHANFSGAQVSFHHANFSAGTVDFDRAEFSGGEVFFGDAKFSGSTVSFGFANFSAATVGFDRAEFSGSTVSFGFAKFSGGRVGFGLARFSGGEVSFRSAGFSGGTVHFRFAKFSGGEVFFGDAEFSGGEVFFGFANFSGGEVDFGFAKFAGGEVDFGGARFSGGTVNFRYPSEWSQPPVPGWAGTPPAGVMWP